jgi:hypothetical protein
VGIHRQRRASDREGHQRHQAAGRDFLAAALAGRLYVGIELEEKYCQLARRRLVGVERFVRRRMQRVISRLPERALVPKS